VKGQPQLRAVLALVIALLEAAGAVDRGCAVCSWQVDDITDEQLESVAGRILPL